LVPPARSAGADARQIHIGELLDAGPRDQPEPPVRREGDPFRIRVRAQVERGDLGLAGNIRQGADGDDLDRVHAARHRIVQGDDGDTAPDRDAPWG
jgi:hypothetical protein